MELCGLADCSWSDYYHLHPQMRQQEQQYRAYTAFNEQDS